ncbi:MAG: hypothetical protein AAF636_11510 [Pseudomonadota bacterium]
MKQSIKLPDSSLAVPGESENEMVNAKFGDRVQIMVEGRVTEAMDGSAVVELETANGVALEDMTDKPMTPEQEEESLRLELEQGQNAQY